MIIHKDCNIFDGGAQGIIHQANCQNTMGSGIAREIRARYPEAYEVDCKTIAGDYKKLGTFSSVRTNDDKFVRESVTEAKTPYEVYHKSYTSAIEAAREYAEKKGYEINNDDAFTKIGMGPRKPSEGKTNRFSIELSKDGKVQRKKLQIQVYGMRNSYELNAYIQ